MQSGIQRRQCKTVLFLLILSVPFIGAAAEAPAPNVITQFSTINAILDGLYQGHWRCADVLKHGDFGICTFDGLDGEGILLEGKAYQAKADGTVITVPGDLTIPFGSVTFFSPSQKISLSDISDYEHLETALDNSIKDKNAFYAVRIDGVFNHAKARSCPKQSMPYPPLVEVTNHQTVFDWQNVEGTFAGFRYPQYMQGLNLPGYHLHFLSKDHSKGGHALQCAFDTANVYIAEIRTFNMILPESREFAAKDLSGNREQELNAAERDRK
ncbi:MAG TPA: acetolactate decarboxylase [Candidatus Hydrogenedentes bacterium]|nr:acetolactate decarboxylase [Candidatus Hydrogenedentota bacterium]